MTIVIDGGLNTIAGLAAGGLGSNVVNSASIVDGSILPVDTQVGALPSMIRLVSPNGYGSTNTQIPRFLTTVTSQGTDITYADSATLGNTFTINTNGVYAFTFHHNPSVASNIGISLNSTQLTTSINSINVVDALVFSTIDTATNTRSVSWTGYLPAGSVIRAHTAGYSASVATFTAVRVA